MPETADSPPEKSGRKITALPVMIVALLMGVEGVAIFFLAKAMGPDPASAIASAGADGEDSTKDAESAFLEVELAECRPSNKMSGKFVTFHIRVTALVASADFERAEDLARSRQAQFEDGVNTVIRSAEPKHFDEPRFDTLKRRLKHEFDRIIGDSELIKEVVIPQLLQSGSGV